MSFLAFVEKNWMLVATLVASGAMLVWPLLSRRVAGGRELGTLGATQLINTKNALLLDVRETKEIEGGKLPNAIHVPLSQLANRGAELAKYVSRPVIAYCDRGQRGRAATALLAKLGFKDVYHLQGGFKAWKDAGLPVQKP
jgi:rhodanese-related sulfurtransferase